MKNILFGILGGVIGTVIILLIALAVLPQSSQVETIITNTDDSNASQVYEQNANGVITVLNYQSQQTLQQYLNGESGSLVETGIGSGFIYKKEDGYYYALTNNHVIEGSDDIRILANNQSVEDDLDVAELVGTDDVYDVAIIRFKSDQDLNVLTMGNSDNLTVGEPVYAIGSPYGTDFSGSISSGILSAPIRKFDRLSHSYQYLQTDTAINPGNSGGPLLNANGEVIGMNSMKIADTEADNMGFAIPINMVMDIAEELENGNVPSESDSFLNNYEIVPKDQGSEATSQDSSESSDNNADEVIGKLSEWIFG